jgi:hypothetical protein
MMMQSKLYLLCIKYSLYGLYAHFTLRKWKTKRVVFYALTIISVQNFMNTSHSMLWRCYTYEGVKQKIRA